MKRVLFATEYDSANIIINVLCDIQCDYDIFPLLSTDASTTDYAFCLQTQSCGDSQRIAPVFYCRDITSAIATRLRQKKAIPLSMVSAALNIGRTEALYKKYLKRSGCLPSTCQNSSFKQFIYFNKATIVKVLREMFYMPTSPAWFTSVYGMYEAMLILTMSYYLLENQLSTVQTTRHYVKCFTLDTGISLMSCFSMREFMKCLLNSKFNNRVPDFVTFAKQKNAWDARELDAVDRAIDKFRSGVYLTDTEQVHFIYLAYGMALNKTRFSEYTINTSFPFKQPSSFMLCDSLDTGLLHLMDKYFTADTYLAEYVKVKRFEFRRETLFGYKRRLGKSTKTFHGSSAVVQAKLNKCNISMRSIFDPVQESITGLLRIASSTKTVMHADTTIHRLEALFPGGQGPLPVFRVDAYKDANLQRVFVVIQDEKWFEGMELTAAIDGLPPYVTDIQLTKQIWLPQKLQGTTDVHKQMYVSRHELFNDNLPVYNFVGDLDIKLNGSKITEPWLFNFCTAFRLVIIQVFEKIFATVIDPLSYGVYFFKSSCDSETFCSCTEKLGLRVIAPFPKSTCIVGGNNLRVLCKILNHTMFLNGETFNLLRVITEEKDCLDDGIYHNGRSIRIPLMYKVDENLGILTRRLLPIVIVPPALRNEAQAFVKSHLDIHNLTHHGKPYEDELLMAVTKIEDVGAVNGTNFMDAKYRRLYNRVSYSVENIVANLTSLKLINDEVHMINKYVWPVLFNAIKTGYSMHIIGQFTNIAFDTLEWPCVQLFRMVNGCKRNFYCLSCDHQNARDNVNVFIDIRPDSKQSIWCTLWSRCFSRKCKSNAKQVHVSQRVRFTDL